MCAMNFNFIIKIKSKKTLLSKINGYVKESYKYEASNFNFFILNSLKKFVL